MKILVLNCGSSSVKYQLFDMTDESVLAKGLVERIGMTDAILTHRPPDGEKYREVQSILEHSAAIKAVTDALTHPQHGVLKDIREIDAVGHRVVHGGENFTDSTLINQEVKQAIEECIELAPLHNPPNLKGILAAEDTLPGVPQAAVFDTAFHATIPRHVYLYALPYTLYQRYRIRRYGFHGTSHKFVARRAAQILNADISTLKIITCHLGNGASITAVKHGKSFDTSMGFTPLEGLIMGTRAGDIDPAIIPFVMAKEELTLGEVDAMLNKHSGVMGVSGLSSDMRDVEDEAIAGNPRSELALDMYIYRIRKYIGAYASAMDGVDAIVFTAGVGERSPIVRNGVCQHLGYLGADYDAAKNDFKSEEREISTPTSKVKIWVIPTNEELMIARDTMTLVSPK
ncbi:acetate/propionate family kinase [candidate division KSB3 bacterium]|uniref:Acetate kinase n=1 Tax=candidate division KSB3 bacterium TaxID=2044937 RepID=A0A9D5JU55_9BACT|nr:acetate/propionate family kinase [candidate division KSB3 bacterium]MBD3324215.1 acetate/propionate family kinase [candidate division KSB3 bacterium]